MTIKHALYRSESETRKMTAEEVSSSGEYSTKYRNHLFCSEEGCDAEIELAHRMERPYFRTWRNSKHAPDCIYNFENDPSLSSRRGETVMVAVSAKHKRNVLNRSLRKSREDNQPVQDTHRTQNPNNQRRTRPVVGGVRLVASVDPDAIEAGTSREPSIRTKKCSDLTPKDIGEYLCIRGMVNGAEIRDRSVHFSLDVGNAAPVTAYFFTPFRERYPQQYGWVQEIAKRIIDGRISNIPIHCIGVCEAANDGYSVQIFDDDESIMLQGRKLVTFMRDLP